MSDKRKLTLPTDSAARKEYPLLSGFLKYFPAAIAGAANLSKRGNDKHNPGEELHHARGKSMDHGDCIVRHLMDLQDLIAAEARGEKGLSGTSYQEQILLEASSLVWRSLAYSQELHEAYGAPLAPAARLAEETKTAPQERYVYGTPTPEFKQPNEPRPYFSHTNEELLQYICHNDWCLDPTCREKTKELKFRGVKRA